MLCCELLNETKVKKVLSPTLFYKKGKIMRYDQMSAFIVMDIVREAAKCTDGSYKFAKLRPTPAISSICRKA
ncbi:hypothetical protein FXB70_01040 [Aggregatibacter actinomycetemcomitans]|nr:hypothetical protein CF65_01834 [Aggregatibacter actinomycetemcomitans HK1651]TQE41815.1 hypothetical protein SC1000_03245 [Aggregatibacter actinomycetemcomitans]TYA16790.1 hypothetical protein FXE10_02355 [Aggregatibacter actinomycetemcomitans]TYA23692.1 hypothetical protein FXB91_03975 [Aggregatibacter actinomycetemcomitans]TYA25690.1 hypothetical protein FXE05_02385 [Aggregatibacter actinomycetemcomitans]